MQETLKSVAAYLPNFPEDIIEQWIGFFAISEGWPPPEPLRGRWDVLLNGRPMSYWRKLNWHLQSLLPSNLIFTMRSQDILDQVISSHESGEVNGYSLHMGQEAKEKMHRIIYYLRTNGSLPRPIILLDRGGAYEVLDGYHRIAAHFIWTRWQYEASFQHEPFPVALGETIPCWVGSF